MTDLFSDVLRAKRELDAIPQPRYVASTTLRDDLLALPNVQEQRNHRGELTGHLEVLADSDYGLIATTIYLSPYLPDRAICEFKTPGASR